MAKGRHRRLGGQLPQTAPPESANVYNTAVTKQPAVLQIVKNHGE